ncbi:MAG: hypothetical protein E7812_02795 [Phenylobacterium sp.]|nr:MAG: hypothetical protein E7812_02795 [Phenylobacterium sp.]
MRNLAGRLERWAGGPTKADLHRQYSGWDYAQADSHTDWDAEPDGLRSALELRATDRPAAFKALLSLAEAGSVVAMVCVGERYFWERETAADSGHAEAWLKRAYEHGSLRALLSYGTILVWEGDTEAAEKVFRRGAAADWAPAIYQLASLRLKRPASREARDEGRALLERAVALGHPAAKWRLARDMARGRFGVRRIPRGHGLLWGCVKEALAAWAVQNKAVVRKTASGETLH